MYKAQCMVVKDLIQHSKKAYYSAELQQCEGDQKAFFRLMDGLLKRKDSVRLPSHDTLQQLASRFGNTSQQRLTISEPHFMQMCMSQTLMRVLWL